MFIRKSIIIASLVVSFSLTARGQSTTPISPLLQRGIMPGSLQVISDVDEISLNSGNVLYRIPLYQFPGGPASVSMNVGLVYNSYLWDVETIPSFCFQFGCTQPYPRYSQSQTGGGWNYSFNYQLAVETSGACSSNPNPSLYRLSVIFPDGGRHALYPKLNSGSGRTPEWSPDAFFGYGPGGLAGCSGSFSGPIAYYTDDGSYAQVQTSAAGSNVTWTLSLSDGTLASFNPTLCGQPALTGWEAGTPPSGFVMQANQISDRNGNSLTVCASTSSVTGALEPQFTITDQAGRQAQLAVASNPGNGQPQDTLTAPGYNNQTLTWTMNWNTYSSSFSYQCNGSTCMLPSVEMLQSVQLPQVNSENLQYQFNYPSGNTNLALQSVTTPYGAVASYLYGGPSGNPNLRTSDTYHLNSGVSQKTISWTDPLGAARSQQWGFVGTSSPRNGSNNGGINVSGPDGGVTEYDYCTFGWTSALGSQFCMITYPNGDVTQQLWQQNCAWGDGSYDPGNPFLQAEFRTIQSSGGPFTAIRSSAYDRNGNLLSQNEWDWTSGTVTTIPSSNPTRATTDSYFYVTTAPALGSNGSCSGGNPDDSNAYWTYGLGPVRNARTAVMVSDNLGNEQLTQFLYDSPNTTANVTSELGWRSRDNFGNSVQFPSNPLVYPPTLNSGNSAVTSHTYGYGGALTSTTDPNNNQTSYASFMCSGANGNGIYPTTETLANGLQTTLNWDCSTGLSTSATDPNATQTSKTYDRIGRIFQTTVASTRQTNYNYQEPACTIISGQCIVTAPTPVTITTYRDLNATGDRSVFQTRTLDQRGRVYRTQNNDIFVDTLAKLSDPATARTYEAVSNPYRSTSDSTMGWTRTVYDTMGRPIEVDHFDGATLPYPWGSSTTPSSSSTMVYDGSWTTITDESGKVKKQHVDGLGRLDTVIEDPAGLNYQTIYTYDVGNNLTGVNQSGQTRTFIYDSLNRLYQATNPESNTTTYTYDPAGNLLTKTDANSVVTTMSYDALNRMTAKSYSNGTSLVTYCWGDNPRTGNCATAPTDSSSSPTCHLNLHQVMLTSSVSTTNYPCYDAFEAPTASSQIMGLQAYSFPSYTYNLMGELTSMTYPSGRVVQTVYDSAGRATCVSGGAGTPTCTASTAYASSVTYAPQGAVSGLTLGNGLAETRTFTTRLQPLGISAGSLLNLQYSYAANGNLQGHTTTRGAQSWTDSYAANCYDGVNRLTCGTESGSGTWTLNYGYDPFGNHWLTNNSTTNLPPVTAEVPQTSSWYLTNNRIGNGWGYDNAGNIQSIAGMPRTFSYDAENRQTAATIGTAQTTYGYDGAGRRVTKTVGTTTTTYVYDAQGQLAAEYGPAPTITGTWYLTDDALGSTRLMTDATGSSTTMRCWDYLPFGEEVLQGYAGRGTCYYGAGYPSAGDVVSQKFTGKERDAETGLDFFESRYYSSAQGRFTSPDEFKGGFLDAFSGQSVFQAGPMPYADITDPQTLNKYGYVRNNPLRYVDPDGHDFWDYVKGAVNAFTSDNAFGAGRMDVDNTDFRMGQAIGDAVATVTGTAEALFGGGEAVVTSPAALTVVGAVVPAAGAAVAVHGTATAAVAGAHLAVAATGSYTNTHESGAVYVGKGSRERSQVSGKRVEKETGDKHVATDHTTAKNSREAFKDESRRMDRARAEGKKLYNKRESPGKKMRQQDGG